MTHKIASHNFMNFTRVRLNGMETPDIVYRFRRKKMSIANYLPTT